MGYHLLKPEELRFPEAKEVTLAVISRSSLSVGVEIRGFTKEGMFSLPHNTPSDRSSSINYYRLPAYPCSMFAYITSGLPRRGQCYLKVFLMLGGFSVGLFFAGYLNLDMMLTWPPGKFESSVDGPGVLTSVTGTNPAAGAEISYTVPTNARWRLQGVVFSLVTSSAVAARRVKLLIDNGSATLLRIPALATQAASLTYTYTFMGGGQDADVRDLDVIGLLPMPLMLLQGWRIRTSTANLQAGDDYGAPQFMVEEWIED